MDLRDNLSALDVSPKKILKIVLGLAVVLLLMWLFTLTYIDFGGRDSTTGKMTSATDSADTTIITGKSSQDEAPSYKESSGIFTNGLITFLVLLVILIFVWVWLERKKTSESGKVQREIDTEILGDGAQLKIVQINDEVWVLGVTSTSVNLLHRYSKKEWKETVSEKQTAGTDIFGKLFRNRMQ